MAPAAMFYNVEVWREAVASLDVVVGHRIHGSMIALAGETPAITVATTQRIEELCVSMRLACMSIAESEAVAKGTSNLTATIARAAARFNGSAFDARRRELAAAYVRRFRGLHLKPHAELQHLARGTSSRPPFSRGATRGARGSTRRGTTPSA